MTNETAPVNAETVANRYVYCGFPSLCWAAIIGGTVAAIGIHILLSLLSTGAGLAVFNPAADNTAADAAKNFSEGAAVLWSISALVAIFFGAVIAGRFSHSVHGGLVHGILVWSLTLIISGLILSLGTGIFLGGGLKVLGEGLKIGGNAAAAGVGAVTKEGVKRSADQLSSFTEEAVQSVPTNAAPKATTRAKREIGFAVTKLFTPGNDINSSTNREAVVRALVEYAQVSEADANKMVDDWIASYKNLQAELGDLKARAEQKAKQAADDAAHNLSIAAIWTFFALLLGLLVSAGGGVLGADHALRRIKTGKNFGPPVPQP